MDDLLLTVLVKGAERYIFFYSDATAGDCLRAVGRYAADETLSLTWRDASEISQNIREQLAEARQGD